MNEGKNLTSIEETSKPEPVLLAVDDDPNTLGRIEHELRQRYGSYYHVACEGPPEAGMRTLQDLRAADEEVAVVLADQWMPGMTGVEFLTHTRPLYPGAKRALRLLPVHAPPVLSRRLLHQHPPPPASLKQALPPR